MAENGFHSTPVGHVGRIPNYGKTQVNPMGHEPPACIQNAMMTKDKKPFTYTPGGLDLSQIRTPSMARRMARQRSQEEHEQAYAPHNSGGFRPQAGPMGGPVPPPPPPPPMNIPAPPPPPPLVIEAPNAKSPKPILGERPEIVIPENPIGMLRKTNSPYHWEAEQADGQRTGPVPKFVEKVPSPLIVRMPPSSFSQQPPQTYTPPSYGYQGKAPESPLHRPEAQYTPNVNSPVMRDLLQRQDSQFNKSPQPYAGQSPVSNGSPYSPSPNNNWKLPDRRDSSQNSYNASPSPHMNRAQFSPQFSPSNQNSSPSPNFGSNTLPKVAQKTPEISSPNNNAIFNNVRDARPQSPQVDQSNPTPWRTQTLNRNVREPEIEHSSPQQSYSPQLKSSEPKNTPPEYTPPWMRQNGNSGNVNNNQQNQYNPPWVTAQDNNNNNIAQEPNLSWRPQHETNNNKVTPPVPPTRQTQPQEPPRFQTTMSIPVTPRRQNTQQDYNNSPAQKEVVYVNQEPVYFCPESPKSIPPWLQPQNEKSKTPPPEWVQRPLDTRRSIPRDLETPPRENQEPEWVRKSNEMQRGAREVISPPKQQQSVQPNWSTKPSDNRKSLPRDNPPTTPGSRVIPIQMEVTSSQAEDQRQGHNQPHLRIVIGMNPNQGPVGQAPYSQPTQRIMRVLSPQLVRIDDQNQLQPDLPSLNREYQNQQDSQPKTRIIPIQIEGSSSNGPNQRVYYHKFTTEAPPRQSKSFRVLQAITGTGDDQMREMENEHGYSDL